VQLVADSRNIVLAGERKALDIGGKHERHRGYDRVDSFVRKLGDLVAEGIHVIHVVSGAAEQLIDYGTTIERVVAGQPLHRVVPTQRKDRIGRIASHKLIVTL